MDGVSTTYGTLAQLAGVGSSGGMEGASYCPDGHAIAYLHGSADRADELGFVVSPIAGSDEKSSS
jgi:hypothetical protein